MKNRDPSERSPHAVEKPADACSPNAVPIYYADLSPERNAELHEAVLESELDDEPSYSLEEVMEGIWETIRQCAGKSK